MRLAAVALCLSVATAHAGFNDGNSALRRCATSGQDANQTYCLGMVAGLYDASTLWNSRQICAPDGVTLGQVRDIFVQHLYARPAERHWSASVLMNNALAAAFPCR